MVQIHTRIIITDNYQLKQTVQLISFMIRSLFAYELRHVKIDLKARVIVLRSAMSETHVLRSNLWWTIPFHILHRSFWDTLGIPTDQVALARHSGVQVPVISRHRVTWSFLDQLQSSFANQDWYLPVPTYGLRYMGCALAFVLQAHSLYVPWYMVHS